MVQKILTSDIYLQINKRKKKKETRVAIGAPAYRRANERRAAASAKTYRRKRSKTKTKVTPEKNAMASANQTPGGYKFSPLVAINGQQGRANQHEPGCFGLSLLGTSRHVCMTEYSLGFLCSDPFRHEKFRPLFRRSAPFPLVLGCSRPNSSRLKKNINASRPSEHPLVKGAKCRNDE